LKRGRAIQPLAIAARPGNRALAALARPLLIKPNLGAACVQEKESA
jgi:hypothetical protein